jgi:hypothetical protein
MNFKKALHTAKLGLGAVSALGATGYGSYHIGKHIGSKNVINQLASQAYNNSQGGYVEKTAQQVAKELLSKIASKPEVKPLEKKASDKFEEIRQKAYNEELQKLGFSMAPVAAAAKGVAKKIYGAVKPPVSQAYHYSKMNPVAAGTIALGGAGMNMAGNAMFGKKNK